MEYWDLLDINRQPLGKTQLRGQPMEEGEYHIVVEIWTVNDNNEVLLTLRHPDKPYAYHWEATAGSILTGETSAQGAVRELFEETGIAASEHELHLLGTYREKSAFVDTYILRRNTKLSEVVLQEGETIDAKWVTLSTLDQLISEGAIASPNIKRLSAVRTQFEAYISGSAL